MWKTLCLVLSLAIGSLLLTAAGCSERRSYIRTGEERGFYDSGGFYHPHDYRGGQRREFRDGERREYRGEKRHEDREERHDGRRDRD